MASARDGAISAGRTAGQDADPQAFLAPHHLAAAERLERLIQRARLMPRVTMSYDPTRVGSSGRGTNETEAASDGASSARQMLNRLAAALPPDCWGVLIDIYGLGKGVQQVESERRWPRRSAKLVLRIGLDQLARQFGLAPHATGDDRGPNRNWLQERLPLIAVEVP